MSHSGWVALWVTWAPGFWKRRKRLGIEKGVISCSAESIFDYLLVTHFQNLGTTLPKMQLTLALHSYNTVGQFRNRQSKTIQQNQRYYVSVFSHSLFSNPVVDIHPQCTSGHWVTSLEGINQIRCSFLLSHKRLYTTWLPDLFTPVPFRWSHAKKDVPPGLTSNSIRVKMQIINRNEKINHVLLRKYQLKTGSSLTVKCRGGRGSEREKGSGWTNGHMCLHLAELFHMRRRVLDCEQRFPPFFELLDPKRGFNLRPDVFIWRSTPFCEWWQTRSWRSLNKLSTVFNSCPNWHL